MQEDAPAPLFDVTDIMYLDDLSLTPSDVEGSSIEVTFFDTATGKIACLLTGTMLHDEDRSFTYFLQTSHSVSLSVPEGPAVLSFAVAFQLVYLVQEIDDDITIEQEYETRYARKHDRMMLYFVLEEDDADALERRFFTDRYEFYRTLKLCLFDEGV